MQISQIIGKKVKKGKRFWRKDSSSDQYQKQYRDKHPEYVNRNRELQKGRNQKRITVPASILVKPASLVLQPRDDGAYLLSKVKKKMIVNRNALSHATQYGRGLRVIKSKSPKNCK